MKQQSSKYYLKCKSLDMNKLTKQTFDSSHTNIPHFIAFFQTNTGNIYCIEFNQNHKTYNTESITFFSLLPVKKTFTQFVSVDVNYKGIELLTNDINDGNKNNKHLLFDFSKKEILYIPVEIQKYFITTTIVDVVVSFVKERDQN